MLKQNSRFAAKGSKGSCSMTKAKGVLKMKAEQFSEMNQVLDASEVENKYLTFWTAEQRFGVSIADVVQIVQMQPITEVPEFPAYAKGIITLRGSIIPIIDVRKRFNMPEKAYDDRTCIIVCSIGKSYLGFIVDRVDEVSFIPPEEISDPPELANEELASYLRGVSQHGNQLVLLINMKKFISPSQIEKLTQKV